MVTSVLKQAHRHTMWIKLENMMLSEISQKQKDKHRVISLP